MKKNILIIGCGKMGLSHLKAFSNKSNLNIYIFDKTKNLKFVSNQNVHILKNLKSLPKINFCIVSTDSKPRFSILKNILDKNRIKVYLIEKFIFQKISQYNFFSKNYSTKNIYINVWGKFIYNKIKKWIKKFLIYKIHINIKKKDMLTNLIHFLDFLNYFTKFTNLSNKNLKIINSNSKGYKELEGTLYSVYGKNKLTIKTKNLINFFEIDIFEPNKKISIKIVLDEKLDLNFFYNNIFKFKKPFPLASFYSYKIFKNPDLVSKYEKLEQISINIIKFLKKSFKKDVPIR
jgi:hypothetical protein